MSPELRCFKPFKSTFLKKGKGKRDLKLRLKNSPSVPNRSKRSRSQHKHQLQHSKKGVKDYQIANYNPITGNRVTVKRAIFPRMIRTKFLRRQSNQRHHYTRPGEDDADTPDFEQSRDISETRTPGDNIWRRHITGIVKDQDVDLAINDSPVLRLRGIQPAPKISKNVTRNKLIRLEEIQTLYDNDDEKFSDFGSDEECGYVGDEEEMTYKKIKYQITRVETCSEKEALQKFMYQEFTESIKRLMIVEREIHFEKFPDAMETLRHKLHKLKAARSEQTCDPKNSVFPSYQFDERVSIDVNGTSSPMDIDENMGISRFSTDNWARPPSVPNKNNLQASASEIVLSGDDENSLSNVWAFDFNDNGKRLDVRSNLVDKSAKNNIPVTIRKAIRKPMVNKVAITNNHEFGIREQKSAAFLFNVPSFPVPDTIDQNVGLDGVEYLKNVEMKNRLTIGDHKVCVEKKNDDVSNIWGMDVYNKHGGLYEDANIDNRKMNDPVLQWRNNPPLFLETVTTKEDTGIEFPFQRQKNCASPRYEEFFPSKRFAASEKNADDWIDTPAESFHFRPPNSFREDDSPAFDAPFASLRQFL